MGVQDAVCFSFSHPRSVCGQSSRERLLSALSVCSIQPSVASSCSSCPPVCTIVVGGAGSIALCAVRRELDLVHCFPVDVFFFDSFWAWIDRFTYPFGIVPTPCHLFWVCWQWRRSYLRALELPESLMPGHTMSSPPSQMTSGRI